MPAPVFDDGQVTLYFGDCFDVMPFLGPVDAVLADLPYGTTRNDWDRELPNKQLVHAYHSLCRPTAPVVVFGQGSFTARFIVENLADYKYTLIWAKEDDRGNDVTGYLNAQKQPLRVHEDMMVFYRRQPAYTPQLRATGRKSHSRGKSATTGADRTNHHYGAYVDTALTEQSTSGMQHPTSVVRFRRPKLPRGTGHPSQKPVELMRWLIRSYTQPGDLILDNTAGSCTTLVAARAEGRRAIGIENHGPFVEMAAARLASGSEEDRW